MKELQNIQKAIDELRIKNHSGQGIEANDQALYEIELLVFKAIDAVSSSNIIHNVSDAPTFDEWVSKYFEKPQVTTIYKVKNQSKHLTIEEMIKRYNKAYSGGR